jgi:isoquinoline 1-oxidoreductase subunit beta
MAVDCGRVINPDRVQAQMEGAAIMAISNALYSNITTKEGRIVQSNFTDYQVARNDSTPATHVYIVESDAARAGSGNQRCRRQDRRSAMRSTPRPASAFAHYRSIRSC